MSEHNLAPQLAAISPEELPPANTFLQTPFWAAVKRSFGWHPLTFQADGAPLLVLQRRVAPGLSIAYVPHGPDGSDEVSTNFGASRLSSLHRSLGLMLPGTVALVRYDLPWSRPADFTEENFTAQVRNSGAQGFRRAAADIQPPSTVLVPLDGTEEELLGRMKRKTRYNIRLAGKRGVATTVREDPEEQHLVRWYRLYRETAERDKIAIHSEAYYRRLFEAARQIQEAPRLFLVEAYHEDEYLAGNIVAMYRGTATYMYGASSNRKRNLMPAYAVQWAAMRRAREEGCGVYDLFGIPPAEDPSHPMHGLYRFKTGFGGKIVHRYAAWDAPLSHLRYAGFRCAERMRNYYYKQLKKR